MRTKRTLFTLAVSAGLLVGASPGAYADLPSPTIPPANIDTLGPTVSDGVDIVGTNAPSFVVTTDMVEPGTAATNPLPDPNAPAADPYISIEPGVPDGPAMAAEAQKTDCTGYGTARGERYYSVCPAMHWKGGVWYVEDHTGPGWPIHSSVDYWNSSGSGMHVNYGCLPSKFHCVKVVEGNYGATGWVGRTTYVPIANSNNDFAGASIQLNDSYPHNAAKLVMASIHELGHAAGLDHEAANVSAMWYVIDGKHTTASSDDFAQLRLHNYNNPAV